MAEVVLSTDDLVFFGGPSSVEVELDFGPSGSRGSQFFVGNGQPNDPSTVIGQTPEIFDLYLNILSSDPEFSYLYQYQNVSGTNTWVQLIKLMPNTYSNRFNNATFIDNQWTQNISVAGLSTDVVLTTNNLNVQHSISGGTNPIASSLSLGELVIEDGLITLPITVNATELVDGEWVSPVGSKSIHLFITVV